MIIQIQRIRIESPLRNDASNPTIGHSSHDSLRENNVERCHPLGRPAIVQTKQAPLLKNYFPPLQNRPKVRNLRPKVRMCPNVCSARSNFFA